MSADDHLGFQFSSTQMDELSTNHYARRGRLQVGYAQTIHVPGEPVMLSAIRTEDNYQNRGIGGRLLDHAISHHAGQDMVLKPDPFGNQPLDAHQLETFYSGHGFEPRGSQASLEGMIRKAKR